MIERESGMCAPTVTEVRENFVKHNPDATIHAIIYQEETGTVHVTFYLPYDFNKHTWVWPVFYS